MSEIDKNLSNIQSGYQHQLEASEHRFRSLVRHGSDLMAILDNTGKYLYITDPAKRVLGYTAGYFLDKNAIDFIHPEDGPVIMAAIKKLTPGDHIELPHYRFKASNGEWRWIESIMTNMIGDPALGGLVVNSRDVTEKKKLAEERLMEAEKKQKQIIRAIVQAQEKERHAIGNELHDNVNQLLTTVKLYLMMARDNAGTRDNLLPKAINYIQDCIDEIRQLTNKLVSPHHPDLALNEAIKELIDSIALTGTWQLNFKPVKMDKLEISEEVQLAAYRIVQEQMTNIIKHANAAIVDISLARNKDTLQLIIADNGGGFDIKQKRKGVGILNMHNRAETVGGSLEIISQQGEGCTLTAQFPVRFM
ncbi:MAG: PAS domain S-box protein [Chitinophagaceae bacterium]|nr:PAS domain S-box protein [Chitinophagaceae bacterium]